eukprot:213938-Amphidinium_carterae.1
MSVITFPVDTICAIFKDPSHVNTPSFASPFFADAVLLKAKNHLELQRLLDVCLTHFQVLNFKINDESQVFIVGPVTGIVRLGGVPIPS